MGGHFLVQRIFLAQGSNLPLLSLLLQQADSLPLCHLGSPNSMMSVLKKDLRDRDTRTYTGCVQAGAEITHTSPGQGCWASLKLRRGLDQILPRASRRTQPGRHLGLHSAREHTSVVLSQLVCGHVPPQPQETPGPPMPHAPCTQADPTGAANGTGVSAPPPAPAPGVPWAEFPTAQPTLGTESVFHKQSFEPNFIFLTQGKSLEEHTQTLGLQCIGAEGCFVAG